MEVKKRGEKEMLKRKVEITKLCVMSKGQEKIKLPCLRCLFEEKGGDAASLEPLPLGGVMGSGQLGGFKTVGRTPFRFETEVIWEIKLGK